MQYLLDYNINIFGAKKLLSKGDIQIKNKNLVVNKEGFRIFQFDENIIIIKAPHIYTFSAITQKKPLKTLIQLWHHHFKHFSLKNV